MKNPETKQENIKGFKVMRSDFTCRGFKFEVGKQYSISGTLRICANGFHFCKQAVDCFRYYDFDPENVVCEVEAIGACVEEDDKCATDNIRIVRQLSWNEVLTIVNTGKGNSGHSNSGHSNSGDRNSGDNNSGHSNSGHSNSGDSNSGDSNSGHRNSGYWNSGDWNSGHSNSGDWNSGDWNSCNFSSGVFNTVEQKIYLFNQPSEWTYSDWLNSEARKILGNLMLNKWVGWSDMTDEEKQAEPKAFVRDGYLKTYSYKEACNNLWSSLSDNERAVVKALPNFSWSVFTSITGIQKK